MVFSETLKSSLRAWRMGALRTAVGGTIVVGTLEATTHLPSEGRSSRFYHELADDTIVPAMRRFLDPETAHKVALKLAILAPTHRPSAREQRLNVTVRLWGDDENENKNENKNENENKTDNDNDNDNDNNSSENDGIVFANPIGLAAGYDKDGTAIAPLLAMGFGFVEIGSVCLQAQPGNPSPRMFRLVEEQAVINRYGFNSTGADAVEEHLNAYRNGNGNINSNGNGNNSDNSDSSDSNNSDYSDGTGGSFWDFLPRTAFGGASPPGVVGINLGKNKTSTTPLEDYQQLIRKLGPYADYLVVNVSCPNLSGLRDLQSADSLEVLLKGCQQARDELATTSNNNKNHHQQQQQHYQPQQQQQQRRRQRQRRRRPPPLLVKLSPDLTDDELIGISKVLLKLGIDGIILTNTTTSRPDESSPSSSSSSSSSSPYRTEHGGLSGKPLRDRSTECIRLLYEATHAQIPIIGVGGVFDGNDAYEKLCAGASLVQVYTGMVYRGPGMVSSIRDEVAELMIRHGQKDLQAEVVGSDHRRNHSLTD